MWRVACKRRGREGRARSGRTVHWEDGVSAWEGEKGECAIFQDGERLKRDGDETGCEEGFSSRDGEGYVEGNAMDSRSVVERTGCEGDVGDPSVTSSCRSTSL